MKKAELEDRLCDALVDNFWKNLEISLIERKANVFKYALYWSWVGFILWLIIL